MLQICTVPVAAVLAMALSMAATASAKELKPKFGNIGGVYYSDVSGNREACRQAIKNKIALCRQNTNFESNTKNRKYKGCLPIFKRQAQSCVVHFRHQMSKCDLSGAARITDFTGFSCTVTATAVDEGGGPDIAPLDRRMAARTRVNLRAGPGTNHRVVGSLAAGQAAQATGRAGDWLRIARPGGGTAFVHGRFMVMVPGQDQRQPSVGKKAPEIGRVNPAIASASRRCDAAASRMNAPGLKWIRCVRRYGTAKEKRAKCENLHQKLLAAQREMGNACCGSYRASTPGEERMVYRLEGACASYKRYEAYHRCRRAGGASGCLQHLGRK